MSSTISTIAPVFISDKFTLNEQISHIRDLISSLSGVVFSSPIKTGKSDYYPALLEVFSSLGGIFRVREKAKLESVFYNLVTCCDSIPAPSRTEFFRALSEGFKTKSCKEDVVARLEYLGNYTVLLLLLLLFVLFEIHLIVFVLIFFFLSIDCFIFAFFPTKNTQHYIHFL